MHKLFIGIGPARCMTTWFVRQLEKSKSVHIPGRKEVKLLTEDNINLMRYKKIIFNNYKSISLDYSNDYSLNIKNVLENSEKIKNHLETDIKFIFLYRDPVNRFLSHVELKSTMLNCNYMDLPENIKIECKNQSFYSKMLDELDDKNTIIMNMDRVRDSKNEFDKFVQKNLEISSFKSNVNENIGSTKIKRIYIFEIVKQKIFNLLEKNDLDIIIQTLRKTKLISLFNFLTDKEVNFIRPEMKDYFKETISEIEEDYINFTKKLKKKIKNEELLRYF